MKKEVRITTTLTSVTPDGEDRITTQADGICTVGSTGMLLRYPEAENGGEATWILTDDVVDLRRKGRTEARFTFIRGRLTDVPYETPHGKFDLQIFTHSVELHADHTGVRFEARYTVLSQGHAVTDNTLLLEARFRDAD